jgi:capsular polysaccharide biosynthesis protein
MDLRDALRVVLAHRLIAVVGLLATAGAVAFAASQVVPTFRASGSLIVLSSTDSATGVVNPYTQFTNSTGTTSAAIQEVVNSQAFEEELQNLGVDGKYDLALDPNSGGAIIKISVEADDPAGAMRQYNVISEEVGSVLAERQEAAGAPPKSWITAVPLVTPLDAEMATGRIDRTVISIAVIGVLLTISICFGADSFRSRTKPLVGRYGLQPGAAALGPSTHNDSWIDDGNSETVETLAALSQLTEDGRKSLQSIIDHQTNGDAMADPSTYHASAGGGSKTSKAAVKQRTHAAGQGKPKGEHGRAETGRFWF